MSYSNLKSQLNGKRLDLSLTEMTIVPVEELEKVPKATELDLSCNLLTYLPVDFTRLQHIVYLDLSKNKLDDLPLAFGNLTKLSHLDLYANNLTVLPVSMNKMAKLKWLDLKDNPLQEAFKYAAGDCLDDEQCRKCAKQVLLLLRKIKQKQDREIQKEREAILMQQQAETEKLAEEERLIEEEKAEKLKEQKRLRKEEKEREKQQQKNRQKENNVEKTYHTEPVVKQKKSGGFVSRCFRSMLMAFLFTIIMLLCSYLVCTRYTKQYSQCRVLTSEVHRFHAVASVQLELLLDKCRQLILHWKGK